MNGKTTNSKPLHQGQILTVLGGRYKGHGARVLKIGPRMVQVMIAGQVKSVTRESLGYAAD